MFGGLASFLTKLSARFKYKSLKISVLVLESKDKFPSFSRQKDEDDYCLEGNPKDVSDFQSSFGLPIFWLSLSTTKFFLFYHSLNTDTSFSIVMVIAFFPRLLEFGQH